MFNSFLEKLHTSFIANKCCKHIIDYFIYTKFYNFFKCHKDHRILKLYQQNVLTNTGFNNTKIKC